MVSTLIETILFTEKMKRTLFEGFEEDGNFGIDIDCNLNDPIEALNLIKGLDIVREQVSKSAIQARKVYVNDTRNIFRTITKNFSEFFESDEKKKAKEKLDKLEQTQKVMTMIDSIVKRMSQILQGINLEDQENFLYDVNALLDKLEKGV